MAKIHKLEATWKRTRMLPLHEFLVLGETLESQLPDDGSLIEARLHDGSKIVASTVAELRDDLASEADDDIENLDVMIGNQPALQLWIQREKADLVLRAYSPDESRLHGAFGPLKKRIDALFAAIDRGQAKSEQRTPSETGSGVSIGTITAGNLAISGSGTATASTGSPPGEPPNRWWKQPWFTTFVAPIVAAVVAGGLLALIFGH